MKMLHLDVFDAPRLAVVQLRNALHLRERHQLPILCVKCSRFQATQHGRLSRLHRCSNPQALGVGMQLQVGRWGDHHGHRPCTDGSERCSSKSLIISCPN